eukprot:CAMPEP_0182861904 /NCGR_PEP_ID=MMETSP0034_2-20130328/5758_1 /TAXON_ID=156128 /ORGANISM="Nephroselmis pyriformis, Strain CCMP717" /LENGTH=33 /DNA_ID= /DNA_START= /DNA_END= /DNA_ORIENTATION=
MSCLYTNAAAPQPRLPQAALQEAGADGGAGAGA